MSLSFPDASTPFWIQDGNVNSTLPGSGQLILQKNETELAYAAPVPNRCWCDLNNGRLLWPVLSGYRYLDGKINDKKVKEDLRQWRKQRNAIGTSTEDAEPPSTPEAPVEPSRIASSFEEQATHAPSWWARLVSKQTKPSASMQPSGTEAYDPLVPEDPHDDPLMNWDGSSAVPADTPAPTETTRPTPLLSPAAATWWSSLARSRYDLRLNGIGMVVDLGLTRTEANVKEEVMEMLDWKERQRADRLPEEEEKKERSEENSEEQERSEENSEEKVDEAESVDQPPTETSECSCLLRRPSQ